MPQLAKLWNIMTKDGQNNNFGLEPKILCFSVLELRSVYPCFIPVGVQVSVLPKEVGFGLATAEVSKLSPFRVTAVAQPRNYSAISKQNPYGTANFTAT